MLPFLRRARDAGFDGVELPLLNPQAMDFHALRQEADGLGLRLTYCTGLPSDGDISHPDPALRRRGMDHVLRCLDGAAAVGSPVLAGVLHLGWGTPAPEGDVAPYRQRSLEALRLVADEATSRKVTLCIELLNRYEGFFLNTVEEGLRFVEETGSPSVKLLLDTFHMNIEEDDIAEAVRQASEQVGHFHCSDSSRKRPGLGHIPWNAIRAALDDIDYQGWVVMECFLRSGDEVGRTMRTWRPLGADLDAAARAGAAFLRARLA